MAVKIDDRPGDPPGPLMNGSGATEHPPYEPPAIAWQEPFDAVNAAGCGMVTGPSGTPCGDAPQLS